MKLKCINNTGYENQLTLGKIYYFWKKDNEYYYLTDNDINYNLSDDEGYYLY